MKKFCAKIALYSIASVILLGVNGHQGVKANSADEAEKFRVVFSGLTECIDKDDKDKKDEDYIITFIEEPLDAEGDETNPQFKKRICYRQTLQYGIKAKTDEKFKTQIVSKVTTDSCLSSAQALATSYPYPPTNNQTAWATYSCREIQVLLSKGGTTLIYGYIGMIYRWGASMVGLVAVLIIILSGIQISAAGGDPEAINKAKTRILQSIGGIVVLFLSGLILYTINPTFFVK